jgi:hypothetical protein
MWVNFLGILQQKHRGGVCIGRVKLHWRVRKNVGKDQKNFLSVPDQFWLAATSLEKKFDLEKNVLWIG